MAPNNASTTNEMHRLLCFALLLSFPQQRDALDDVPMHSVPQNLPCADQPKTIRQLTESFGKSRIPSPGEISGSWVAIGFLGETPSFNCNGVTRGSRFEWVMFVNQYSVEIDMIGMNHHQKTTLKPDNRGSLAVPVEFGGDTVPVYKCRLTQRNTLACMFRGPGGTSGVEFKKIPVKR